MKKYIGAISVISASLMLVGCSAGNFDTSSPEVTPVSTQQQPEAERSSRGNLIKKVGEVSGVSDGDKTLAKFVLTSIEVDPVCNAGEYTQFPPQNGHYVALKFDVETFPELQDQMVNVFNLNYGWKYITPEGTTFNGMVEGWGCFDDPSLLPMGIGPAEKATGYVLLDLPDTSGTLVFNNGLDGWEWTFPQ